MAAHIGPGFSQNHWCLRYGHSFSEEGFWLFLSSHIFQDSTLIRVPESSKQNKKEKRNKRLKPRHSIRRPIDFFSIAPHLLLSSEPLIPSVSGGAHMLVVHIITSNVFITLLPCSGVSKSPSVWYFLNLPYASSTKLESPKNWMVSPEGPSE